MFYPDFIGPVDTANVSHVADHIEHIAGIVGKNHVGIASDFDGMYTTVIGLEDTSKYPNLVSLPYSFNIRFPLAASYGSCSRANECRLSNSLTVDGQMAKSKP